MSNRKNLIKESSVSKMMKLAGLKNLREGFISERFEDEEELPADDLGGDDLGGDDMDMGDEGGDFAGSPDDVEELVSALADVLAAHTGVDIEVEGGDMDMEDDLGDEDELDMDMEDDLGDEDEELDDLSERHQRGREPAQNRVAEGWEDEEPATRDPEGSSKKTGAPGKPGKTARGTSYPRRRSRKKGLEKPRRYVREEEELEESDDFEHPLNKPGKPGKKKRKPGKPSDKVRPPKKPSAGGAKVVNEEESDDFEHPLNKPGKPGKKKRKQVKPSDKVRPPRKTSAGGAKVVGEDYELEEDMELEEDETLEEMEQCDGYGKDPNKYTMEESVQNEIAKKVVAILLEKLKNKEQ
jgi:hypothetical protein